MTRDEGLISKNSPDAWKKGGEREKFVQSKCIKRTAALGIKGLKEKGIPGWNLGKTYGTGGA